MGYAPNRSFPLEAQGRDAGEAAAGVLAAVGRVTLSGQPTSGKVVSIYGKTFEFRSGGEPSPGNTPVAIGASAELTRDALYAAMIADTTLFGQQDSKLSVIEKSGADEILLTAKHPGAAYNATITDDDTNVSVSGMHGGSDGGHGASAVTVGTKTIAAAATPEPLVSAPHPCRHVWVGAPITVATGAALNTKTLLVGNSAAQNMPIVPGNFEGFFIAVDDASKVYVKAGQDGEKVEYQVFS